MMMMMMMMLLLLLSLLLLLLLLLLLGHLPRHPQRLQGPGYRGTVLLRRHYEDRFLHLPDTDRADQPGGPKTAMVQIAHWIGRSGDIATDLLLHPCHPNTRCHLRREGRGPSGRSRSDRDDCARARDVGDPPPRTTRRMDVDSSLVATGSRSPHAGQAARHGGLRCLRSSAWR